MKNRHIIAMIFTLIIFLLLQNRVYSQSSPFSVSGDIVPQAGRKSLTNVTIQIRGTGYSAQGQICEWYVYDKSDANDIMLVNIKNLNTDQYIVSGSKNPGGRYNAARSLAGTFIIPWNTPVRVELKYQWNCSWCYGPLGYIYFGDVLKKSANWSVWHWDWGSSITWVDTLYISYQMKPITNFSASDGNEEELTLSWDYPYAKIDDFANFTLTRNDGKLITITDFNQREYTDPENDDDDYPPVPGRIYDYDIKANYNNGWNIVSASDQGFVWPDGKVTGAVETSDEEPLQLINVRLHPHPDTLNGCMQFDGTDDYIIINPMHSFPTENVTVEFWMKSSDNQKFGTPFSYAVSAGQNNTFLIYNYNNFEVSIQGTTTGPTNVSANDGRWHHIAVSWRSVDGQIQIYKDGDNVYSGTLVPQAPITTGGALVLGQEQDDLGGGFDASQAFLGMLDEVRLWRVIRSGSEIKNNMNHIIYKENNDLVACWRFNSGEPAGIAGDYSQYGGHHGNISGAIPQFNNLPMVYDFDQTNENGFFSINNVYYSDESNFYIVPDTSGSRDFNPDSLVLNEPLNMKNPSYNAESTPFVDESAYSVSGYISMNGCGISGVEIYRGPVPVGITADGHYSANAQSGTHIFTPKFHDHGFVPASRTIEVTEPVTNINFEDTTRYYLRGRVGGGSCAYFIGEATLEIRTPDNCFSTQINTTNGNYEVRLPAFPKFYVEVIDLQHEYWTQIKEGLLGSFVDLQETSLSEGDNILNFTYYAEPELIVSGLPDPANCGKLILTQTDMHQLQIAVIERYGDLFCPADSGSVHIYNDMALYQTSFDTTMQDTMEIVYSFRVGAPNLDPGGTHPHQWLMQITAATRGGQADFNQWAIVTGHRPRQQTFVTVSPEIPLIILRDPPGDRSYSFIEKQTTSTFSSIFSVLTDVSINQYAEMKVGVEVGGGLAPIPATKIWGNVGTSLEIGGRLLNQVEQEIRVTTTNYYQTDSEFGVIGEKGDVFIGAALSLLYAITDELTVDENCRVNVSQSIVYGTNNIATYYMYTGDHIRSAIIPKLLNLKEFTSDKDSLQYYNDQIEIWEQTLQLNEDLKTAAETIGTYQFNGGGSVQQFQQSVEITKKRTIDFNLYINAEVATEAGLEIGGSGYRAGVQVRTRLDFGRSRSASTTHKNTVGFGLQDDDTGDSFQFQLKGDPVYGTHVFAVEAGESSCPWESWDNHTLPRDGIALTMDTYSQSGVDPDGPAVFDLTMINTSPSGEKRSYMLFDLPEANPDGAILKVNGIAIKDLFAYSIDPDQSRQAKLTVERSPGINVFDYENLKIGIRPVCEKETFIADTATFSVHFTNPCSPATVLRPENNWYVNQRMHDSLLVILQNYDKNNLTSISLEYSPVHAASWSTAMTVNAADMPDNNFTRYLNTATLDDGRFNLRFAIRCAAGTGYSELRSGVIDRRAPRVFGNPEPADGILKTGDEISISFDEAINSQALTSDNVRLIRLRDGVLIPVNWTYSNKKLIISPQKALSELENEQLQMSLAGVRDIYGNVVPQGINWTFEVNSNPVYWEDSFMSKCVYLNMEAEIINKLINSGTGNPSFNLSRYPAWLEPDKSSGMINSGSSELITFTVSTVGLRLGTYRDTVFTQTPGGVERMIVELNVLAEPPDWQINPENFAENMSLTAGIYLNDLPFSDENDILAAFVNGELRGKTQAQKLYPQNEYAAFLMVYSNLQRGETVTFTLWDASDGRQRPIGETVTFIADTAYGSAAELYQLHVGDVFSYAMLISARWSWISFGLEAQDMSTSTVLSRLKASEGDIVKAQSGYSQYLPGFGWVGNLDTMSIGASFKMKTKEATRLDFIGIPINVVERPISIEPGWNWIAFLPDQTMTVNDALANFTATAGDLIKNKTAYASYNGSSWEGTLENLLPGEGYMLKSAVSASLIYPEANGKHIKLTEILHAQDLIDEAPAWTVNPNDFEHSVNVTATVSIDGIMNANPNTLLGAFVNSECRGITKPVFVADKWLYFLTAYANLAGESVYFQTWDAEADEIRDLGQVITFEPDSVVGSAGNPFSLSIGDPSALLNLSGKLPTKFALNQNYPNPFNPSTKIRYALKQPEITRLTLYDNLGRVVKILVEERQNAGWYEVEFDASHLASGVYFYKLVAGPFTKIRKMVLIK